MIARSFSLEATRPSAAEIASLGELLPRDTSVYFSAVPTLTPQELVAGAALLRKGGLEPVVHIAARRIHAAADLQDLLTRLHAEADVRRLLVIGGDVDTAGAFPDALAVMLAACLEAGRALVVGTTGLDDAMAGRLRAAAAGISSSAVKRK